MQGKAVRRLCGTASLLLLVVAPALPAQERPPVPVMALYSTFSASVGADLASTLHFRATCPTCYETNPLMRPFVEAGAIPTVAVTVAGAAGLVWLSEYLRRQPETKHIWWIPVALGTVGHLVVAWHNSRPLH